MHTSRERGFHWKRLWAAILIPAALLLVVFVAFDPIVEWRTREALKMFEGYTVTFEDASLQPTKLNYGLTRLKILKDSAGGDREPFFYVEKLELSVYWKELLRGHIVARMDLNDPKLSLITAKTKSAEQLEPEIPDFSEKLKAALPITVDRVQVKNGELKFIDKTEPDFPKIWLHGLDATLENLATRAALARGEPTTLAVSATAQKTAELSAWISADPLSKGLYFAGRVQIAKLELNEFQQIMASKSGLQVEKGTLELFAEFDCRDGHLTGGVKPVIKNASVVQGKPGIGNGIKTVLANAGLKIFSDRPRGGGDEVVATVIPISGNVTRPGVQLWPTILGVVRNAFVQGVSESFERLPPPVAKEPQGPLKQAVDALDRKSGGPKAEPDKERGSM
jgi:hypothetical protein